MINIRAIYKSPAELPLGIPNAHWYVGMVIWVCENILDAQMGNVWLRPKFHVHTATEGVV